MPADKEETTHPFRCSVQQRPQYMGCPGQRPSQDSTCRSKNYVGGIQNTKIQIEGNLGLNPEIKMEYKMGAET